MAILPKTRKILWGKSGNRCAICKQKLVLNKTEHDKESVVGDEAHIVSKSNGGPRGHIALACDHDDYQNLILLCKVHHKMVDDQTKTYSLESLILIKCMHEAWVEQSLDQVLEKGPDTFLGRVTNGKDLTLLFPGSLSFSHDHDIFESIEVDEIAAEFLESVEYYEMWDEMEFSPKLSVERKLTNLMERLSDFGYWVFAGQDPNPVDGAGNKLPSGWKSFIVLIVKKDNSKIIQK